MNLPNQLTVARIIMTPIFMAAMLINFPHHYLVALVLFAAASFTDFLDGNIARARGIVTNFGKFLDPLADKMLTTAAYLGFMFLYSMSGGSYGWQMTTIVFIVLFREFMIASLRLVAVSSETKKVIPANIWGKAKTVSQMVSTILIMLLMAINSTGILPEAFPLGVISQVLLWITAVLAVISGIIYIRDGVKQIDFSK